MTASHLVSGGATLLAIVCLAGCGKQPERAAATEPISGPSPKSATALTNSLAASRPPLSEAVERVVRAAPDNSIAARMTALRAAGNNLSEADQEELLRFLGQTGAVEALSGESIRWLKNDIMNLLCVQQRPVPGVADAFARIFRDYSQDAVIRDYAVQHLGAWYASEPDTSRRTEIERTLWDAVRERDGTIAGTALIALGKAAQSGKSEAALRGRLGATALETAGDSGASLAARVTALQVCSQLGMADALPLARDLARDDGDMSLRISAVAALGRLGGTNDVAVLQGMAGGAELRLQPAARAALAQLQAGGRNPGSGVGGK